MEAATEAGRERLVALPAADDMEELEALFEGLPSGFPARQLVVLARFMEDVTA